MSGAGVEVESCGQEVALRILMIERVCTLQRVHLGKCSPVEMLRTKAFLSFATREAVLF